MSAASLATTQASAEKWRTGLAGFVTLVTSGLLIKGPDAAHDLTTGWRLVISVLGGAGLALATLGLWLALRAAAGTPARVDYSTVLSAGGTRRYSLGQAARAARTLQYARTAVFVALVVLGFTVISWWWATPKADGPFIKVFTDSESHCGELLSADEQVIRVQVAGRSRPTSTPLPEIENLSVTHEC